MRRAALILALALGGCGSIGGTATPESIITTQDTKVVIPVDCAPNVGPEPNYPDTDAALAAAPDIFKGVQLLKPGRAMRIARIGELTAGLEACAGGHKP